MDNEKSVKKVASKKLVALKDWRLVHNEIDVQIKEGDDVGKLKLPEGLLAALQTEGVIKK